MTIRPAGSNSPTRGARTPWVWTDRRVTDWQRTGEHPAVAVWTAAQLAYFLHAARGERFYPLWWLVALRGLRRGEACGLRWADVDLDQHCLTVTQQLTYVDGALVVSEPKSRASRRVVALDPATVQVLHAQARRQRADAAKAGDAWQDTGYVFTRPDGTPLRPDSAPAHPPPNRPHRPAPGCGCTTCVTPPASPTPPAPTPRPSRTSSATPASS